MLKTYGAAPYGAELKKLEKEIKDKQQTINEKIGMYSYTTTNPDPTNGIQASR